jgi:uncharacterized protein involved in tolerance to divalent cations
MEKAAEKTATSTAKLLAKSREAAEQTKMESENIERVRERQKCAVLFPKVFGEFSKSGAVDKAGICPCQGSATGVSSISLRIGKVDEANGVIGELFQAKLVIEAVYNQRLQRTSFDSEGKVKNETEGELLTVVLVCRTANASAVVEKLDSGKVAARSEIVVSALSTGKSDYMKWVEETLLATQ